MLFHCRLLLRTRVLGTECSPSPSERRGDLSHIPPSQIWLQSDQDNHCGHNCGTLQSSTSSLTPSQPSSPATPFLQIMYLFLELSPQELLHDVHVDQNPHKPRMQSSDLLLLPSHPTSPAFLFLHNLIRLMCNRSKTSMAPIKRISIAVVLTGWCEHS